MARGQHEAEAVRRRPHRQERVEHRGLLAAVRAPRHDDRRLAEMEKPAPELLGAGIARRRLHLEVARDENPLGTRPEADDPPGVLLGLHAEEGHVVEHPAEEAADESVAAVGAVGDPPVGEHRGHLRPAESAQEVGPQLRLERDEAAGPDPAHGRRTAPPEVERERERGRRVGEPRPRHALPGGRHRRDDDVGSRPPDAQGLDQRHGRHHLAHRDGVDPEAPAGQGRGRDVHETQPLPERQRVAGPPDLAHQEQRQVAERQQCQDDAIEPVHRPPPAARSAAAVIRRRAASRLPPLALDERPGRRRRGTAMRLAEHDGGPGERVRDEEGVPGAEDRARRGAEAQRHDRRSGRAWPAGRRPACATCRGPRGPSGTTRTSAPSSRTSRARASEAPGRRRARTTRARRGSRSPWTKRLRSSPSRERLARAWTGRRRP